MEILFPQEEVSERTNEQIGPEPIELIALGDSLTEGVGDSTNRGGYVPLVSEELRQDNQVAQVSTRNYGRAGATSHELLALLNETEEVREGIAQGNVIAITIGGNDIVETFREVGLDSSLEDFEGTLNAYQTNLNQLLSNVRSLNGEASIYLFGVYNPYHYYFSDFEELQQIFDMWNESIQNITQEYEQTYFVELDSRFNPSDMERANEEELSSIDEVDDLEDENHPYLFEADAFHPNDEGYQLMADALYEMIHENLKSNDEVAGIHD